VLLKDTIQATKYSETLRIFIKLQPFLK